MLSRRALLGNISIVVLVSASARPNRAQSHTASDSRALLVQLARDVYPHPVLEDSDYGRVVSIALKRFYAGQSGARINRQLNQFDSGVHAQTGVHYHQASESVRLEFLTRAQAEPWFDWFRIQLRAALYDDKVVWPKMGYEGSSWEKGGYLARGFDDIDWL